MRTIIEIPENQLKNLSYICSAQNISRAEAIRRAIAMYLEGTIDIEEDSAFGLWKSKKIDGLKYQLKARSEW